jgi:DNA-directed RNA polymerase specialized sigma24 family protein
MREMILTPRTIALDALRYLWLQDQRTARATYLRYMRDCTYAEIAQELSISLARARQLAQSGNSKLRKYIEKNYGIYAIPA